eukprot:gene2941-3209_t
MKISISTTIFCLAFLFLCSDAFHQNSLFYNTKLIQGKTKALQTAGPQQGGFIPRLEPGLRLLKPHINSIYEMTGIEISSFPLDKLKEVQNAFLPPSGDSVVGPQRIPLDGLFKRAVEDIGKASRIIVYYLKRFLAMSMILMSTWSMPTLRRLSYVTASAVTALISGPRMIANAATPQKYQKLAPYQKVGTTPLYYVCNSRGNSYLQEDVQSGSPNQRIVTYFMSSEDANDYLDEMTQSNSQNVNEFRIMTVSMEKVLSQIQAKKQSRKMGRFDIDLVYRIQPSARQCENAEVVAGKGDRNKGVQALEGVSIPMFSAEGFAIKRGNGEIVTPYYFAYEDLLEDWSKLAQNQDSAKPAQPKVVVRDFADVMCLSAGLTANDGTVIVFYCIFISCHNALDILKDVLEAVSKVKTAAKQDNLLSDEQVASALQNPGIVPPRREIEMIKSYYRNRAGIPNEYSKVKMFGKAG